MFCHKIKKKFLGISNHFCGSNGLKCRVKEVNGMQPPKLRVQSKLKSKQNDRLGAKIKKNKKSLWMFTCRFGRPGPAGPVRSGPAQPAF